MKQHYKLYLFGALILCLIPINVIAQTTIERVPVDSIWDGEYLAVKYHVPFDTLNSDNGYGYQYEIYLGDDMVYKTILYPFISIGENAHGFIRDLNKDGKNEFMVYVASGGNNGAEDVYIYSIDSTVVLINALDGMNKIMPWFSDIDNDSIQEIIFYDNLFLCWYVGCAGSPRPPLIWKWNGESYKIANFKLRSYYNTEYITDSTLHKPETLQNSIKWWVKQFYGRKGYEPYPVQLWTVMLDYIYFGYSDKADSVFHNFWPEEVAGKDEFYKEFRIHLKSGPYWEELQQSGW